MNEQTIQCPKCKYSIPLTKTSTSRSSLTHEVKNEVKEREDDINKHDQLLSQQLLELKKSKKLIDKEVDERVKALATWRNRQ